MRSLKKTIFIVCEGESTEPDYFERIRDIVYTKYKTLNKSNELTITISPIPKTEKKETFQLRAGAKKSRRTNNVVVTNPEPTLEEENKPQPKNYIRKAQILGLESEVSSDVWAVYDKDQHPEHKEAVALASQVINESNVQIGFSSIAFEFWILLHFDYYTTAFEKSMCRIKDEKGKNLYFYCGTGKHKEECDGNNCVCGKLVTTPHLSYSGKGKDFDFDLYHPKVNQAIENSLKLFRSYSGSTNEFYEENPYTNIYRLVFKLLHLPIDYNWFDFNETLDSNNILFSFKKESDRLIIDIKNNSEIMKILQKDKFRLIEANGEYILFGDREKIDVGISEQIQSKKLSDYTSKFEFIGYELDDGSVAITEIP